MNTDTPDQELVRRVQSGDKRAYDLLVAKYQHRILKLIGRYVRDSDDALDVAQETFLKAYRALPKFRGDSQFYTWLYRIAINTSKNHLVSLSRRPQEVDLENDDGERMDLTGVEKVIDTPEGMLSTEQMKAAILEVIEELPEDLRMAITLREVDGLSYEDIAEAMDCPIGTVRSRIFRARDAIDKRIRPMLER